MVRRVMIGWSEKLDPASSAHHAPLKNRLTCLTALFPICYAVAEPWANKDVWWWRSLHCPAAGFLHICTFASFSPWQEAFDSLTRPVLPAFEAPSN